MIFNVKWVADKRHHCKAYQSEKDARKAKKWLIDNGATEVKIVIVFDSEKITVQTKS